MQLTAETVDEYQGFQYVIPQREASHKAPYVKVRWQNAGVVLQKRRGSRSRQSKSGLKRTSTPAKEYGTNTME